MLLSNTGTVQYLSNTVDSGYVQVFMFTQRWFFKRRSVLGFDTVRKGLFGRFGDTYCLHLRSDWIWRRWLLE